jgi:hypothetical protein
VIPSTCNDVSAGEDATLAGSITRSLSAAANRGGPISAREEFDAEFAPPLIAMLIPPRPAVFLLKIGAEQEGASGSSEHAQRYARINYTILRRPQPTALMPQS